MKIVFLARYLPQHGSITHCYALAQGLIDRGHDIHMVSAGPTEKESAIKIFNESLQLGIKHHTVGFPLYSDNKPIGRIKQLYQYATAVPRGLTILFKLKPDIIHVHYPVTSYLAKIYCSLTRKKFVTTYHISGIPKHPLHTKADYVIAISSELQKELSSRLHYNDKQIKLIYNGVSTKKFHKSFSSNQIANAKNSLELPSNKTLIGFIGSYTHRKGIDVLLDAVHTLNKSDYHLILVGESENDDGWITSQVTRLNLDENVTIYPYRDPVIFYEIMDIFVLPSRKEGFPLVTIEAMMMGIPTIRSRVEGSTDQIEHGKSGYLFTNEDSNELSRYIQLLLSNEALRKSIGERSRVNANMLFSDEIMITKLLSVYKQAMNF